MSKINPQRLTTEEFKDQSAWIGKLFAVLNQFMGEVVTSYSNALSVEDNLYQEIKELKFVNNTSYFPLKFRTKFAVLPKGMVPIYVFNNTTGASSPLQPWLVWSYGSGEISISAITGLTAGSTYTIRVLVIYA